MISFEDDRVVPRFLGCGFVKGEEAEELAGGKKRIIARVRQEAARIDNEQRSPGSSAERVEKTDPARQASEGLPGTGAGEEVAAGLRRIRDAQVLRPNAFGARRQDGEK